MIYWIAAIAILLLYFYISYWKKKGIAPGPVFPIPFIGEGIQLIADANKFWTKQAELGPVSCNYVFGKFMVFVRDNNLTKAIFVNQNCGAFKIVADPFNTGLFGENNLIHMSGTRHKFFRQQFTPLFTAQKLDGYFHVQRDVVWKHLNKWNESKGTQSLEFKSLVRDLNLENSQKIFLGNYPNAQEISDLNINFPIFNDALFSIPIEYPGSTLSKGKKALFTIRHAVESVVERCMDFWESVGVDNIPLEQKKREENSENCVLDWWLSSLLLQHRTKEEIYKLIPLEEIAHHIFDQLYASQDASVSSLMWVLALLNLHPEHKDKIKEELETYLKTQIYPDSQELTFQQLRDWCPSNKDLLSLTYLDAVTKELLRYRPPAPLLTHLTLKDFSLAPYGFDYVIPRGALVFPSIMESGYQGFSSPDKFNPERFIGEHNEGEMFKDFNIPFGVGPHRCIGRLYAVRHIKSFIIYLTLFAEWKRDISVKCADPNGDIITYGPTTFPINTNFFFKLKENPTF